MERLAFETAAAADTEEAWDALSRDLEQRPPRGRRARTPRPRPCPRGGSVQGRDGREDRRGVGAVPRRASAQRRNARAERNRREAAAFEEAKGGGRAALQEFLRRHADGLLAKDAQRLLRQVADAEDFEHAKSMDKAGAWQLYLQTHPSSANADVARQRLTELEDIAFAALLASKNPKAGAEFLADFPESPRRDELTRLVAKWNEAAAVQGALDAIAAGDLDRADSVLGRISDGERRREVVDALEAARDQQSWEEAQRSESPASLHGYLDARPNGRWASEARKRLAKLQSALAAAEPGDWERRGSSGRCRPGSATSSTTPTRRVPPRPGNGARKPTTSISPAPPNLGHVARFLKTRPEGRHRMDAEVRLRGR